MPILSQSREFNLRIWGLFACCLLFPSDGFGSVYFPVEGMKNGGSKATFAIFTKAKVMQKRD